MLKILVVDDENLIRYCLSATFKDPSISVRTAASGKEALLAIREDFFDICILDLHLPDMSGIDIMQMIRVSSPKAKIVVISGESLTRETRRIVEENAGLYLEKPFDLDEVRSYVNQVRDQREDKGIPMKEWSAAANKRRHVRTAVDRLIRFSAVAPDGEAKAIDLEAKLRDISEGGMRIFTEHLLEPGWWLMVSDGGRMNEGVVRWSKAAQQTGTYYAGIQISNTEA
jgi:DNA-binding response OmpR family regulator